MIHSSVFTIKLSSLPGSSLSNIHTSVYVFSLTLHVFKCYSLQCHVILMFLHLDTCVRAHSCLSMALYVEGFKLFMHNAHKSADFTEEKTTLCKALRYLNCGFISSTQTQSHKRAVQLDL